MEGQEHTDIGTETDKVLPEQGDQSPKQAEYQEYYAEILFLDLLRTHELSQKDYDTLMNQRKLAAQHKKDNGEQKN